MKTITFLIFAFLSPFLVASEDDLYEISTHLVVDKEILEKHTFITKAYAIPFRTYEDKKGNVYQVFYQVFEGEKPGAIEISAKVETLVVDVSFLVYDNEGASFVLKREMPEFEVAVKARKLPAKPPITAPSDAEAASNKKQ